LFTWQRQTRKMSWIILLPSAVYVNPANVRKDFAMIRAFYANWMRRELARAN
jgi:hypothetical protein